jgi:hypothetical protein
MKQCGAVANELLLDASEYPRAFVCPVAFQPSGLLRDILMAALWPYAYLFLGVCFGNFIVSRGAREIATLNPALQINE